jgi:ClpA/ClpB-like protein
MSGCWAIEEVDVSQLPPRPSLGHLRKQAKDLLRELRQQRPAATLVEAQHALARRYGFASWPKLKAHVEQLAARPSRATFHRYSAKAREAVFFARDEAARAGSATIEPKHVLLGLIRAGDGLKGNVFDAARVSLELARRALASVVFASEASPLAARVSTSDRVQQIFRAAAEEADSLDHDEIRLAHMLLGLLREADAEPARLLDQIGVRAESVRRDVSGVLNERASE